MPETKIQSPESEEALLLRAGYRLALRGGHEVLGAIAQLPGQANAAKAIRSRFEKIVEEVPFKDTTDTPLDLQKRLEALIAPYADSSPEEKLEDFLAHLALWGEEEAEMERSGSSGKSGVVTISTYHSAKGLEFERVICMGLHNSAFPAFHCGPTRTSRNADGSSTSA